MTKRSVRFKLPPKKILFSLNKISAGSLVTESKPSAENHGTILQVGSAVTDYKKGDSIVAAMWAVEHAKIRDEDYYFIECDSPGLLCAYE